MGDTQAFAGGNGNDGDGTFGLSHGTLYAMGTVDECVAIGEPERGKHFDGRDETLMLCLSVPGDDGGTHAGESWLVPLVAIGVGRIARRQGIDATDMAERLSRIATVTSDELDRMLGACWYYPCVPVSDETTALVRHVATLGEWREADGGDDVSAYGDGDVITAVLSRDDGAGRMRTIVRKVA